MRPGPESGPKMDTTVPQIALHALAGCLIGALAGWSVQAALGKRRLRQLAGRVRQELDALTRQRDEVADQYSRSLSTIESLQAANAKLRSDLESLAGKSKKLAKNVLTLRAEREKTKDKISTIQAALISMRQQSTVLQSEFQKARKFYKRELLKSLERRKTLEEEVRLARVEQESLASLVESSIQQHGSPENMLAEAHLRLGQLNVLERNINKLEAENTELRSDAVRMKQQLDAQGRDLAKLEELRLYNQQLVTCVEALESSRQEYEADAERYRQQADQSEEESETLRLKLQDLKKNFADIEEQQRRALEDVRQESVIPLLRQQR